MPCVRSSVCGMHGLYEWISANYPSYTHHASYSKTRSNWKLKSTTLLKRNCSEGFDFPCIDTLMMHECLNA